MLGTESLPPHVPARAVQDDGMQFRRVVGGVRPRYHPEPPADRRMKKGKRLEAYS